MPEEEEALEWRRELWRACRSLYCPEQAAGLKWLVDNLSDRDRYLPASFLVDEVKLAYEAKASAPWGLDIPDSIFFNYILPPFVISEKREKARQILQQKFATSAQSMPSASHAAAHLNHQVFAQFNVKYSPRPARTDQSPIETIESGTASCTGLSILLVAACRSVAVPARFVGIPRWADDSGNHSWVEIWDPVDKNWHFTGAAEPTDTRLDESWFTEAARKATPSDRLYGIYAVSFAKTDTLFPIVWPCSALDVCANEVTDRYILSDSIDKQKFSVQFRMLDQNKNRVATPLVVRQSGTVVFTGTTKDDRNDRNDNLAFGCSDLHDYDIEYRCPSGIAKAKWRPSSETETLNLFTDAETTLKPSSLLKFESDFASDTPRLFEDISSSSLLDSDLSKNDCYDLADVLVSIFYHHLRTKYPDLSGDSPISVNGVTMRFVAKVQGLSSARLPLYISLHGGGNCPAQINDLQWRNQLRLYDIDEGVYIAPRAPTDTWNQWHLDHIDECFTRLIEQQIAFRRIDPDRVYLTGYSSGGDGVYQLAPRMADQFAAAAMMAGHPNDSQPDGLRNLPFTLHVGELDEAYNRNKAAADWSKKLGLLRQEDGNGYIHLAKLHPGKGHWMDGDDVEGVHWMSKFTRQRFPDRVLWVQSKIQRSRYYWLSSPAFDSPCKPGERIIARRQGNVFVIEYAPSSLRSISFLLSDEMEAIDLDSDLRVLYHEREIFNGSVRRKLKILLETLEDRGDFRSMYSAKLTVGLP